MFFTVVFSGVAYAQQKSSKLHQKESDKVAINNIVIGVFTRTLDELGYEWNIADIALYCGRSGLSKAINSRHAGVNNILILEVNRHESKNKKEREIVNNFKRHNEIVSAAYAMMVGYRVGYSSALKVLDNDKELKRKYCKSAITWADNLLNKEAKTPEVFKYLTPVN